MGRDHLVNAEKRMRFGDRLGGGENIIAAFFSSTSAVSCFLGRSTLGGWGDRGIDGSVVIFLGIFDLRGRPSCVEHGLLE